MWNVISHFRHVYATIAYGTVDNPFFVPFVTVPAGLKVAQVRCYAARDRLQTVTARTVLVVCRSADAQSLVVDTLLEVVVVLYAVRVAISPLIPQRW